MKNLFKKLMAKLFPKKKGQEINIIQLKDKVRPPLANPAPKQKSNASLGKNNSQKNKTSKKKTTKKSDKKGA